MLLAIVASSGIPLVVHAQQDITGLSREQIIEANYSGPVFLDAYWTSGSSDNDTEVDVGPGDGASILAVVLINRGPSDIAGITGRLSLPDGFQATGKSAGSPAVATYNQLAEVGSTFTLFFDVDVHDDADVGEYTARLSLDYSKYYETGTPRNVEMDVPFRITGEAIVAVSRTYIDGNASSQIAAGKIEDYVFSVANNGNAPITNVVVTIESSSESLKILGDSKWTVQSINEDSKADLATKVFAATSLIGNPAVFDVTVEYSSNGQSYTGTYTLGAYIAGEISLQIYDLAINYIGDTPNLVGNLLNEGTTTALFTTIEIVEGPVADNGGNSAQGQPNQQSPPQFDQQAPPQFEQQGEQQTSNQNAAPQSTSPQYLGDLTENSPLPFSIPLNLARNAQPGQYQVTLKVIYKDDLRNAQEFVMSGTAVLEAQQSGNQAERPGFLGMGLGLPVMGLMLPLTIGGIGAAVAAALIIRRRKRAKTKKLLTQKEADSIETILSNPDADAKKDHPT